MFSTFAALSGLAFFLGLRMAGLAIVVRGSRPVWWRPPMSVGSEGGLVIAGGLAPATLLATLRLGGLLGGLLATPRTLSTLLGGRRGATGGPRVGGLLATTLATEATTGTAAALGLGDLRGRVAQRRTDLVDVELDDGALLA